MATDAVPFTGRLAGAGAATMWISLSSGALATACGPWLTVWLSEGGCGFVQLARLLLTGALTAWFIFVLVGALLQALAESSCADAFTLPAHVAVCVDTVRALMALDQRGLAFVAYFVAAYLTNLVPDARVTLNLVFFGAAASVAILDGGPGLGALSALTAPERATVAGTVGAVLAIAIGWGVLAKTQSVVVVDLRSPSAVAAQQQRNVLAMIRSAAKSPGVTSQVAGEERGAPGASLTEIFEGAARATSARPNAYGDSPAHRAIFTVAGAVVLNMTAWLAYYQTLAGDSTPTRGWPSLVRGDPADTWAAVGPGFVTGVAWFFAGPALVNLLLALTSRAVATATAPAAGAYKLVSTQAP